MLDYAAFPEQRQALIRQLLHNDGRVQCSTLVEQLGVSEHTIRRDLQVLADEGLCKRVYGGAVSVLGDVADFQQRIGQNSAEKKNCARLCRIDPQSQHDLSGRGVRTCCWHSTCRKIFP